MDELKSRYEAIWNEVLKNRYDLISLLEAIMCNQNGDPSANNMPRTDFVTGRGIITDVSFKSHMRGFVQSAYSESEDNCNILMRQSAPINRDIAEAVLAANHTDHFKGKANLKTEESRQYMCDKYWDVRAFGGVLSTGLNAGQVTGAVQVGMSLSVDPIEPTLMQITRKCYTEGDYKTLAEYDEADVNMPNDKKRTFGKKTFAPYGLYPVKATVSANLARKVGFTERDFHMLLEAMMHMYNYEPTSSKTGMALVSPIIIFKHVGHATSSEEQRQRECLLGCAHMHTLHNLLHIEKKDGVMAPRSVDDYNITLRLSKMPDGVICGFKRMPFADIEWIDSHEDIALEDM